MIEKDELTIIDPDGYVYKIPAGALEKFRISEQKAGGIKINAADKQGCFSIMFCTSKWKGSIGT